MGLSSRNRLEKSSRSRRLGDCVLGGEPDDPLGAELVRPLRVEQDLRLLGIQDLEYLVAIALRVRQDLLARQRRPGLVLSGRVSDHAGEVADQELDLMPEVLEVPQLVDDHRMAEVQIRGGGIESQLDAQFRPLRSSRKSASSIRSTAPRRTISSARFTWCPFCAAFAIAKPGA